MRKKHDVDNFVTASQSCGTRLFQDTKTLRIILATKCQKMKVSKAEVQNKIRILITQFNREFKKGAGAERILHLNGVL